MKKILVAISLAVACWIGLAQGADMPHSVVTMYDGGTACTSKLNPTQQYAIQCDGGVCARTCIDGGTCEGTCATDVRVEVNTLYDIVIPPKHNQICVFPEYAGTIPSCKVFQVHPQQLNWK